MRNATIPEIREKIQSAPEGSDIHGILEKVAYKFHRDNSIRTADENWSIAQEAFAYYVQNKWYIASIDSLSDGVKRLLNNEAYFYNRIFDNSFDSWMNAQQNAANRVMDNYHQDPANIDLFIKASTKQNL